MLALPAEALGARCVTVIPARGGSRGIPRKNVRPVGGIPLIGRTVRAARSAQHAGPVFVSTDDAEIAATATRYGALVIERPASLGGDAASSESALLHAIGEMRSAGMAPNELVFLQCTSPFTTAEQIDRVILERRRLNAGSALSVVDDHAFLWRIDGSGFAAGINHDHLQPRQRRQDRPPQFRENGAIYVIDVAALERHGTRFAQPIVVVPVEGAGCGLEIDEPADLQIADAIAAVGEVQP